MSTTKHITLKGRRIKNENDKTDLKYMTQHSFVEKEWGYETWFVNTNLYCGKQLHLNRFSKSSRGKYHYHKIKDETFYVIKGAMILYIVDPIDNRGKKYKLKKGDSFRIKPIVPHRFETGWRSCTFIEVSTHHKDSDSYYGV